MIRWVPVNTTQEDKKDEKDPREVQVEQCLEVYQKALRLHHEGHIEKAKELYQQLVDADVMQEEVVFESQEEETNVNATLQATPSALLQYLVFKNFGSLLEQSTDLSEKEKALEYYVRAVTVDTSDHTLWYNIGKLARFTGRLRLARFAFERGLPISLVSSAGESSPITLDAYSLGPMQWWCLDELCEVLYDIGDFSMCLQYLDAALNIDQDYQKGLELKKEVEWWLAIGSKTASSSESLNTTDSRQFRSSDIYKDRPLPPIKFTLKDHTWVELGKLLLNIYEEVCSSEYSFQQNENSTSLEPLLGRRIEIVLDTEEKIRAPSPDRANTPVPMEDLVQAEPNQLPSSEPEPILVPETANSEDNQPGDENTLTQASMIDDDAQSAAKRKRNGVEDEGEEKRSLRMSKRVREKVDPEEEKRRLRDEQEKALTDKTNALLEPFGISLFQPFTKDLPQNSFEQDALNEFHEWFKTQVCRVGNEIDGIDGLEENRRNLRRSGTTSSDGISQLQSKPNIHQYTIFSTAQPQHETHPLFETAEISSLQQFIRIVNQNNSGIVDYLCTFVRRLIVGGIDMDTSGSNRELWFHMWPVGLKNVVGDIVCKLGENLVEQLALCENYYGDEMHMDSEDSRNQMEARAKLQYSLAISELILDRAISFVSKGSTASTRLQILVSASQKTLAIKKATRKSSIETNTTISAEQNASEQCMAVLHRWLSIVEREIENICVQGLIHRLKASDIELEFMKSMTQWEIEVTYRYLWVAARKEQYLNHVDAAVSLFTVCENLVTFSENAIFLPNCTYDSVIDSSTIRRRIDALKMQKYIRDADTLFIEKDYRGVIDRLSPLFSLGEASADDIAMEYGSWMANLESSRESLFEGAPERKIMLLDMLIQSFAALENAEQVWLCAYKIFIDILRTMIGYAKRQSSQEAGNAADEFFWWLLDMLRNALGRIISAWQNDNFKAFITLLSLADRWEFMTSVCIVIRISLTYMFYFPAFISSTDLEIPINTKTTILGIITVRSWVVFATFLENAYRNDFEVATPKHIYDDNEREADQSSTFADSTSSQITIHRENQTSHSSDRLVHRESLAAFLSSMHDEMGIRELCGQDDGSFLRLCMRLFRVTGAEAHRLDLYQCYNCLYNICLSIDADYPEDHRTQCKPLDKEAASQLFEILEPYMQEKVVKGAQMKSDVKEVIDKIVEEFEHPPYDNAIVSMNKHVINQYLASDINFPEDIDFVRDIHLLPTVEADISRHKIPSIYFQIYYLHGKNFQTQAKAKGRNQEKVMEDLGNAVGKFTLNLYLNSWKINSWHSLGACYRGLADEHLAWSASNIVNNKDKIADYQRKAFHCFAQAVKLAINAERNDRSRYGEMASLWCDFGYLTHSMTCAPMDLTSFKHQSVKRASNDDGEHILLDIMDPNPEQTYKFAIYCFKKARQLDKTDWKLPYMLGKCYEKLRRKPDEILEYYRIAAGLVPPRSGLPTSEKVLEPTYKILSCLAKFLYGGLIEPSSVQKYLVKFFKDGIEQSSAGDIEPAEKAPEQNLEASTTELSIETPGLDPSHDHSLEPAIGNANSSDDVEHQDEDEHTRAYRLIAEKIWEIRNIDKRKWHHKPVYRHAWLWYHGFHDPQKAQEEIQRLFSLKTTSKTFVNIWRPEFERPGRHFAYVHHYTLFLIQMAKESGDIECLKVLCRKLIKASNVLLKHTEQWTAVYRAYVDVMRVQIRTPEEEYMRSSLIEVVPKSIFEETHSTIEVEIFSAESKPPKLLMLQDLFEVKRLNNSFTEELDIDELICDCYSQLFVQFGQTIPILANIWRDSLEGREIRQNGVPGNVRSQSTSLSDASRSNLSSINGDGVDGAEDALKNTTNVSRKDILRRATAICKNPPQSKPRPLSLIMTSHQTPPPYQVAQSKEASPIDLGQDSTHEGGPSLMTGSVIASNASTWGSAFVPVLPYDLGQRSPSTTSHYQHSHQF